MTSKNTYTKNEILEEDKNPNKMETWSMYFNTTPWLEGMLDLLQNPLVLYKVDLSGYPYVKDLNTYGR